MTLPKPYYADDWVTLYHGECEELLPLVQATVTITDPPYNVGKDYGDHDDQIELHEHRAWLRSIFTLCATPELVWFPGTKHFLGAEAAHPETHRPHRILGWHKKEFAGDFWGGGPAMCWEPIIWASANEPPEFVTTYGWRGRDFLVVPSTHGDPFKGEGRHPCPKPQVVMDWLVGLFAPEGAVVLDPFAGTGTTLHAARSHGVTVIGIERNEAFCELAVERLAQQRLPIPRPADPQASLDMSDSGATILA